MRLTASWISCEGATAPPGESTRRTTALMSSSLSYFFSSLTTLSESIPAGAASPMVPFASTMPMRAPAVVSVSRLMPVLVLFSAEYASSMKPNSTRNRPPKMTPSTIAARLSNVDDPSRAAAGMQRGHAALPIAAGGVLRRAAGRDGRSRRARGLRAARSSGRTRHGALTALAAAERASVAGGVPGIAHERAQIGTICIELQASTMVARPGDDATPLGRFFHLQAVRIEQERVSRIEVLRRMQVGERGLLRAGTVHREHGQPGEVQ